MRIESICILDISSAVVVTFFFVNRGTHEKQQKSRQGFRVLRKGFKLLAWTVELNVSVGFIFSLPVWAFSVVLQILGFLCFLFFFFFGFLFFLCFFWAGGGRRARLSGFVWRTRHPAQISNEKIEEKTNLPKRNNIFWKKKGERQPNLEEAEDRQHHTKRGRKSFFLHHQFTL